VRDSRTLRMLLATKGDVFVFKHSTRCPTSAAALRAWQAWAARVPADGPRLAMVRVVEERALSQSLARLVGLAHRSPQVLLLRNGRVAWHASHGAITEAALDGVLARR